MAGFQAVQSSRRATGRAWCGYCAVPAACRRLPRLPPSCPPPSIRACSLHGGRRFRKPVRHVSVRAMTATRLRSTALRFAASLLPLTLLAASDPPPANPGPGDIIAAAPQGDWVRIPADDLLVMDLAPDAKGRPRRVVIQLMPAPFSSGWVSNIRKLAAAHWWDDAAIVRVQDNYVVQWGDPDAEDEAKAKPLPAGIAKRSEERRVG